MNKEEAMKIFDTRFSEIVNELMNGNINQTRRKYLSNREDEFKMLKKRFEDFFEKQDE